LVIGFAAETENVLEYATKKRKAKGADWIVANDVSPQTGIMGGDRNTVHLVTAEGVESWPELDKGEVARRLMQRAAERLAELNGPGTIDSDYRGEVQVLLANLGQESFAIGRGERIAQLVVQRVAQARLIEIAEIAPTQRGAGGFGSTGSKAEASPAKRRARS